jgi:hypothetical protein
MNSDMSAIYDTDETEQAEANDRRSKHFRFERSINLGTLITIGGGFLTALLFYQGIISRLDHIERAAVKADVMWEHFMREHQDISTDDLRALR